MFNKTMLDTLNAISNELENCSRVDYEEVTKYYIEEDLNDLIDYLQRLRFNDYINSLNFDTDYNQYYTTSEYDLEEVCELIENLEVVTSIKLVDKRYNETIKEVVTSTNEEEE